MPGFKYYLERAADRRDHCVHQNRTRTGTSRSGDALSDQSRGDNVMSARPRRSARHSAILASSFVLCGAALSPAAAADVILSGTIASASGEKLGGVTVSGQAATASTITTSVYTDEQGNYYFPPMPAGKYNVWAQALGFETTKGEVDLSRRAARRSRAQADRPIPSGAPPAAGRDADGGAAGGRPPRTRDIKRIFTQQLHRLPHAELRAAVPVRRGRLEQDHRPDEGRPEQRGLSCQSASPTRSSISIRRSLRPISRARADRAKAR